MLNLEHFLCNPFQENCYLAYNDADGSGILVDPGFYNDSELSALSEKISEKGIRIEAIFLTHGHCDHIYGVKACADILAAPVFMHPADIETIKQSAAMASRFGMDEPDCNFCTRDISDGEKIHAAGVEWEVISTPGHTPGGVCYHCPEERILFTGDTLFRGTIGRSDLPGGNYDELIVSIMDKIMGFDGSTDILCGHGPSSNIGEERTHNPFLEPFNEPEQEGIDWDEDGIELNGQN